MDEWHQKDSDDIFIAVSRSCKDLSEARRVVVEGYVTDKRFSREGISDALKRLEMHYTGNRPITLRTDVLYGTRVR